MGHHVFRKFQIALLHVNFSSLFLGAGATLMQLHFILEVALARRLRRDLIRSSRKLPLAHLSTKHGGGFTLSVVALGKGGPGAN